MNENKNYDEALQDVVMETSQAVKETGPEIKEKGKFAAQGPQGEKLKDQSKQLTEVVWMVLKEMARSGEFRAHLSTLLGIVQEMLSVTQDQLQQGTPQQSAPQGTTISPLQSTSGGTQTQSWKLSEEKKHQLSFNFLSVLRKFNERPEFRAGLENLAQIFQDLGNRSGLQQKDSEQLWNENVASDPHACEAFEKSKTLIERFTGSSIETFLAKNRELFSYTRKHPQIQNWWNSFVQLLRDSFQKPDQLNEFEFTRKIEALIDEANQISQQPEFKSRYLSVMSELRFILNSIKDDPDVCNLQEKTRNFLDNFTYIDEQGKKRFNSDLLLQMRQFIVPLLFAQLENIPIPPIEGSNEDYDYYFDNMVLHGQEIFPDMIEMHSRSDAAINLKNLAAEEARNRAEISVSNIKFNISDIHFKFNRKTFPKLSDEGLASVHVEGDTGVSLKILLDFYMQENTPHVKLSKVKFDIEKLKIDIQQATHQFLLKIFASIYQTRTKKMIEDATEKKIHEIFQKLEEGINNLFSRYPPSKWKEMAEQKTNQMFDQQPKTNAFQS